MKENDQLTFEDFNPTNTNLVKKRLITDSLTKDKLVDLYFHQNKSLQDIAKEYNCTRQMVKLLMERYDLQRRKRSEARVLAIKEGKFEKFKYDDINENFFSEWTPQMAWVLGVIFTDGCIRQEGGVSIYSIDYELLENIRHHLNSTKPIKKIPQSYDKTKHIFRYEFIRKRMREDLKKLGLIQRKSLTMQFPEVSENYMRHFIRGCWDGDGTVYLTESKIEAKYVSGSKDFIKRLVDELFKIGIVRVRTCFIPNDELRRLKQVYGFGKYPLRIYEDYRSKTISYSIKLNSRDNIEKLFYYFYAGADESMYLKRKYDVFVKGLNLTEEELILQRDSKFEYTSIPIRPFSIEPQPKISRKKIRDVILSIEARTNKKVLTINNSDRKLRCFKCGKVSEVIYLISQPYCPNCLSNNNL